MHLVDSWANLSRWREHPVEVMALSGGLILLSLVLPPMPAGAAIAAVSTCSVVFGARVPLGAYLRVLAVPMAFLVTGCIALVFSVDFVEGGLSISATPEGWRTAGRVFLRSLAAISAMLMLAISVPMGEILSLLRRCRVPAAITELMGLIYRMLFVFNQTLRAMLRAQGCRLGFRNLRTSYRSLGAALAALFVRAMDRAHRLERGLAARGYQHELHVLSCRHAVSLWAMLAVGAVLLGIAALGLMWQGGLAWPI